MGFLKRLKDAAEQGVEKGAELGKKAIEKAQRSVPNRITVPRTRPKRATPRRRKKATQNSRFLSA